MRTIDGDALLKRVQQEEIQAQVHGREFSTCFLSQGGTPSTEWWYVEDLIENAPTIESERKKGKWKLLKDGSAICSECGFTQQCAWDLDNWDNFCHHCGADMREVK